MFPMMKLIKKNPIAVGFAIIFAILITVGIVTSHAATLDQGSFINTSEVIQSR